jgi:hypothetical protein
VYWTIIFGGQPTAFRASTRDELMPTFKQIQSKHPDAQLRYFARGKLWYSEEEAQAALMRERVDKREREARRRPEGERRGPWKPRDENRPPRGDNWKPREDRPSKPDGWKARNDPPSKPDGWKPRDDRPSKPDGWKPRADFHKPHGDNRQQKSGGWKPRSANRPPKPGGWKPRGDFRKPDAGRWKPPAENRTTEAESEKPTTGGWKPKDGGEHRGRDWRPGGVHKDPRARFKIPRDAKRRGMARKFGWKKKDEK